MSVAIYTSRIKPNGKSVFNALGKFMRWQVSCLSRERHPSWREDAVHLASVQYEYMP